MALDPRTLVLIGVVASQRGEDPTATTPLLHLLRDAAEGAAVDRQPRPPPRCGAVHVPKGSWTRRNAATARIGNPTACTLVAEIGILQATLSARAAGAIASAPGFAIAGVRDGSRGSRDRRHRARRFPAAVRVQLGELRIGTSRQRTVTGGMTIAGWAAHQRRAAVHGQDGGGAAG